MSELLKTVISLSVSGSLLMLVLFLSRPLFRERLSRQWQYYIWLVVIVRLLLPLAPEANLMGAVSRRIDRGVELSNIFLPPAQEEEGLAPRFHMSRDGSTLENNGLAENSGVAEGQNPLTIIWENLGFFWLMTALILLIRKITVYQSFVKYIRAGSVEVTDINLLEQFGRLVEQSKIKCTMELNTNSLISSPLLIGFFRPCIVLPSVELPESDLRYTILHELTHYKRKDMFYKWLAQLTICAHWFNPLVFLMSREISRACELSCDEAVIMSLDRQGQRAYGDTLLNAAGTGGCYKESIASVTLSESKERLKERLDAIMGFRKKSKIVSCTAFALTFVFMAGAAALGSYAAIPAPVSEGAYGGTEFHTLGNSEPGGKAQKSSGILPEHTNELDLSLDVYNGGVEIRPASSREMTAYYDDRYYAVEMAEQNGRWVVSVSGKKAKMGEADPVQIQVPDVKCKMDVKVLDGDFRYDLPEDRADMITIAAANAGVYIASKNGYKNSSITLTAAEKEYLAYGMIAYPDYFTTTDNGFKYQQGTEANQINISLTGYTNVEFSSLTAKGGADFQGMESHKVKSISLMADSCGIEVVKSKSDQISFDLLGIADSSQFIVDCGIDGDALKVTVDGTKARSANSNYYINQGPDYVNVVRIAIPDRKYDTISMELNGAPVSLPDLEAAVDIKSDDGAVSVSDKDISKGSYRINNTSGSVSIAANTILSNMSVESEGECCLALLDKPENLRLDLSGCQGGMVMPEGWSKTRIWGNGAPVIRIVNDGYTEVSVKE